MVLKSHFDGYLARSNSSWYLAELRSASFWKRSQFFLNAGENWLSDDETGKAQSSFTDMVSSLGGRPVTYKCFRRTDCT